MESRLSSLALLCALLLSSACAPSKGPEVASSASQIGYAKSLPASVENQAARYETDVQRANEILSVSFAEYPSALSDTDWERVQDIYEKAQDEGRGRSYSAHRKEAEAVLGFYNAEKKQLVGRVAGASKRKVKEGGCDVDLYGTTDWSLQKAMMDRLVERRREASDAHTEIHRNEDLLGRKNEAVLEKQVDEILFASYMAHVGAKAQEQELQELVDEASSARTTLKERLKDIEKEEKPDAEEVAELKAALEALTPAKEHAEARLKEAEQTQSDLEEAYDKAWKELTDALKKSLSEAQAAAGSEGAGKKN